MRATVGWTRLFQIANPAAKKESNDGHKAGFQERGPHARRRALGGRCSVDALDGTLRLGRRRGRRNHGSSCFRRRLHRYSKPRALNATELSARRTRWHFGTNNEATNKAPAMHRVRAVCLIITMCALAFLPHGTSAQQSLREQLVGAWILVSNDNT